MRKPREHGWRTPDGITHHINTLRYNAYQADARAGTCGVDLRKARRVQFDVVDCMTCIVYVARHPRLPPRPTPDKTKRSWWTTGGERHVLSTNDPWRAVCGASLRATRGSSDLPNCLACGAKPRTDTRKRIWRTRDSTRHVERLDDPKLSRRALCGADLTEARATRKASNCVECRTAPGQEGRNRGRQLPRAQRR